MSILRLFRIYLSAAVLLSGSALWITTSAHAEEPIKFTIPANDESLPGSGPVRRYDWFQNLWQKKRSGWAADIAKDQNAVVFLGDSITQGWGDNMGDSFPGVKVANRGISGDTTRGMLMRLEEDVLSLHPKAVVMLMGTNDLEEGADPATVAANVILISKKLREHHPDMPVVLCQVFPSSSTQKRPAEKIKKINEYFGAAAEGEPRITLLDTWTLFANADGDAKKEEFPDLLHPNEKGYAKWAAALRPVFATLGLHESEPDNFKIEEGFTSLFNGHDLTGWGYAEQKDNQVVESFDGKTTSSDGRYAAINGRLVVKTPTEGRRLAQLWTKQQFPNDFVLKLEFRATPNADSGVFLRKPQLQCRDYLLAGPYKDLKNYKPQDWNEMTVTVKDGVAKCTCNGEVLEAAKQLPKSGPIGLEGDRGQIEYRRIRIQHAKPEEKPLNVVFILADDLGFMDISPNNPETFYETPNLQRLAAQGMRFTQGYAACPVCSPTRSSILTGQYPARTRNTDYFNAPNEYSQAIPANYDPASNDEQKKKIRGHAKRPVWPAPYIGNLASEHMTLAESLKGHGYSTFFAGKWHLGQKGSWPEDHGFDVNKGGIDRGGPYGGNKYFSPYGNPRLEDGPKGEHLPDRLASETSKFITEHKDSPFLAYLSFYSVHTPLIGREDLVKKYQERRKAIGATEDALWGHDRPRKVRWIQEHAIYAAMVEAMDLAVGKVLTALEDNGIADRTIVVFFSDNGGLSTSEGWPTSNLPYRAGKGWLYEGGIREPMLVRWPGVTKPGSICEQPMISTDFYPTLLEACGLPAQPKQHIDGVSIVPLLKDPAAPLKRAPLFWHYAHWGNQGGIPGSVIRDGDWKLIDFYWGKKMELYNIVTDPGEAHNLASSQPEKAKALLTQLNDWRKSVDALAPAKNPGFEGSFDKW